MRLVAVEFRALPVDQVAQRGAAGVARRGAGAAALGGLLAAVVLLLVAFHLGSAGFFADGADAQTDLLLVLIHFDDLELVFGVHIERHWLPVRTNCLGDVAKTFDSFGDFYKGAELRGAQNL